MPGPKKESELPVIENDLQDTDSIRIKTGPDNGEQVDKSVDMTIANFRKKLRGYLSYIATLTQSGVADPIAMELENSLGDIVWTRTDAGASATGTLAGAFPEDLTFALPVSLSGNNNSASLVRIDDNTVKISPITDNILDESGIEIRVYDTPLS